MAAGLAAKHADPLQRTALPIADRGTKLPDVPLAIGVPLLRLDRGRAKTVDGGVSGDDQV